MFTIQDLINQVEVQGPVQIKRICGDDIDVVFDTEDFRYESVNIIEPFLNR